MSFIFSEHIYIKLKKDFIFFWVRWEVNWAASEPIDWNLYAAHFRGLWLTCVTLSHLSDERLRPGRLVGMPGWLDAGCLDASMLIIIPPPILALKCQVSHFGPLNWNVLAGNSWTRAQFFVATKWHESAFKCPSSCYTVERAARILLGNILPQSPTLEHGIYDSWMVGVVCNRVVYIHIGMGQRKCPAC